MQRIGVLEMCSTTGKEAQRGKYAVQMWKFHVGFRGRGNSDVTSGLLWMHVGWQSCIPAERERQALRFAHASKSLA